MTFKIITTESGRVYQSTYSTIDRLLRIRCAKEKIMWKVLWSIERMDFLLHNIALERQAHSLELTNLAKEDLWYLQDTIAKLEILVKDNPTLKVAIRRKL
jgi:hypothetical protein